MSKKLLTLLPNGRAGLAHVEWSEGGPLITPLGEDQGGEPDGILTPGFVDIHCHGGFGIDFMSASSAEICEWADKLSGEGYEFFLPTTVTCSAEAAKAALSRLPDHPLAAGVHLEGPFISPEYPGAQPPSFIKDPANRDEAWSQVLGDPRVKVVTLAPERPGALELIGELNARGIAASMGHTAASWEEAKRGFDAGIKHSTHTYNAMKGLHHREPGALGFILSEPGIMAELIYDRVHVSPGAARVLYQAKGWGGVIAVSDATQAAGMPSGAEFEMWDLRVYTLNREVRLKSNGALAGSAITLKDAFINICQDFGLEAAVRSCSLNPRRSLKMTVRPRVWVQFSPDFSEHTVIQC